jgi:antitoxin Phd
MTSQTSHNRIMPRSPKKPNREVRSASASTSARTGAHNWQLQTAKAKFSEVFRRARTEGPQRITKQGKEGVVMISDDQYDKLTLKSRQPKSIVQFFRESPLVGVELDLERDKDAGLDVDL